MQNEKLDMAEVIKHLHLSSHTITDIAETLSTTTSPDFDEASFITRMKSVHE